jgi:hypothetical protein
MHQKLMQKSMKYHSWCSPAARHQHRLPVGPTLRAAGLDAELGSLASSLLLQTPRVEERSAPTVAEMSPR